MPMIEQEPGPAAEVEPAAIAATILVDSGWPPMRRRAGLVEQVAALERFAPRRLVGAGPDCDLEAVPSRIHLPVGHEVFLRWRRNRTTRGADPRRSRSLRTPAW